MSDTNTVTKMSRDGSLAFYDYDDVHQFDVPVTGNFSWDVPGRTIVHNKPRGVITDPPDVRYDQDQECTWSFEGTLRDLTDPAAPTLSDLVHDTGFIASDWVSRLGPNRAERLWRCVLTINAAGTSEGDHGVDFDYCHVTGSVAEGAPGKISVKGTSHQLYPTLT